METDRHAVPRLSHGLSLRGVLLVVLSAMTIYATVMMVFLSFQVVRVATSVGKGIEPSGFSSRKW